MSVPPLFALPTDLFTIVLSFLSLKAEAALVRTCKVARERCKGKLHQLLSLHRRLTDEDCGTAAALFFSRVAKRKDIYEDSRADRIRRSRHLKPYMQAYATWNRVYSCSVYQCPSTASAIIRARPLCSEHAVEVLCAECGNADIPEMVMLAQCVRCGDRLCHRCVRIACRAAYCSYCSRRCPVDENIRASEN